MRRRRRTPAGSGWTSGRDPGIASGGPARCVSTGCSCSSHGLFAGKAARCRSRSSTRSSERPPPTCPNLRPEVPTPEYNPAVDGRPLPGEVVWTWVAYDQDSREGKERPVLVLAVDGARLTVLELRSKRDERGRRSRQVWLEVGVGGW